MDIQPLKKKSPYFVIFLLILGFIPYSQYSPQSQAPSSTTTTNQALAPMTTNQVYNTFASCFQNQCTQPIKYVFKPSGFAYWSNPTLGNITHTGFTIGGQSRSVTATSNSTTIDYHISVPNIVTMDVYFKEKPTNGIPSNTFKVTMIGTSSVAGTFSWNFGNPNNFPVTCDNTKHTLTYGIVGINFTDSTNFSATCTATSISFTIGIGTFRIDPTTVTTGGNNAGPLIHGAFGLINTRYWYFYTDNANCRWVSSLNGVTWTTSTIIRACLFALTDIVVNSATNRIYYAGGPSSGSTEPWRSGILNSDGTIIWDFAEQTITLTGTMSSASTNKLTITPTGDLITAVITTQSTIRHIEVWKCVSASSSCTPSKINDLSTVQGLISMLSFSDSSLALLYTLNSGTVPVRIITCPSTCATSTDWSTLVSTVSDVISGNLNAVTISTTIYAVEKTTSTTIKYWKCTYPCNSSPSETTITSSATTVQAVTMSTDNNIELVISMWDSGVNTISYFYSFNTGTSWSPVNTYVISETNLAGFNSANAVLLNGILNLAWRQGASSPFNLRFTSIGTNGPWIIQSTSCTFTGLSGTCAFASNTKAQSTILVLLGSTATTTFNTPTDTQSLTYTQIIASDVGTVGDNEAWLACHPTTASADTITVSASLSVTATIILYELHGRPTGTACGTASSSGSSASASTATVTSYTPTRNAFIIAALDSSCQVACTITAGSGYSLDKNININAVNDYTTEYFWNVQTADTSPYTFSVASAYNEISVAFYDFVWTNSTSTNTFTYTDAAARLLLLTRATTDIFTYTDIVTRSELILKAITDTFTYTESAIANIGRLITDTFTFSDFVQIIPPKVRQTVSGLLLDLPLLATVLVVMLGFIFIIVRRRKQES